MKDAWPVKAQGLGGRHYRGESHRPELRHLLRRIHLRRRHASSTRRPARCPAATTSSPATPTAPRAWRVDLDVVAHAGASAASTRDRISTTDDLVWAFPQPEPNPYQLEWDDLIDAIRQDKPYNEANAAPRPAWSRRWAAWPPTPGQVVTYDQILNCDHEFAPDVDKLTMDSPAPLQAGPDGKYPIPQPGIVTKREF